ncbi:MAG TPA: hypothetical protein VFZ83_01440 [Acidimicrobiia bacterium]|nr:hypothetical protein [Acidimicrobiia bacterium]
MSDPRALLEREMADLELHTFTLDEFHHRRRRAQRNRRVRFTVMSLVLAAVVGGGVLRTIAVDPAQRIATSNGPAPEPPSPFIGMWASTDTDGSSQTLEIRAVGDDGFAVVMHDDAATQACVGGGAATLTGTAHVEASGTFVIVADAACDDGSIPEPLSDPARAADFLALLARMELRYNSVTDELIGLEVVWRRAAPDGSQDVNRLSDLDTLTPGRYFVDLDGPKAARVRATFEVAAEGWEPWIGVVKESGDGAVWLSIVTVDNVMRDACLDQRPAEPAVGPTVDDLATALAGLAPFEVSEPPTDVELFGYRGKHLALTVPALAVTGEGSDREFIDCTDHRLRSWMAPSLGRGEAFYGYNGEVGRTEEFWILDVDGTRVVIVTNTALSSVPDDVAELRAIFDSIRIEPAGATS